MDKPKKCPKCEDEKMELGSFTGQEVTWKKDNDQTFLQGSGKKIKTYACQVCGYMESYVIR